MLEQQQSEAVAHVSGEGGSQRRDDAFGVCQVVEVVYAKGSTVYIPCEVAEEFQVMTAVASDGRVFPWQHKGDVEDDESHHDQGANSASDLMRAVVRPPVDQQHYAIAQAHPLQDAHDAH